MIFIEIHNHEDPARLAQLIRDACAAIYGEPLPGFSLGRIIVWQDRKFQRLEFFSGALEYEDRVFYSWTLPPDRARVLVGSILGEVFTTPPAAGDASAARVKEGGRCGREYVVTPFHYSDDNLPRAGKYPG